MPETRRSLQRRFPSTGGSALRLLPLLLLLLLPGAITAQGLTPEQVLDLEEVASVALSPDGAWVAYTVIRARGPDDPPGRAWSSLHVVAAEGGEARAVVEGPHRATDPAWSPDGATLAFVADLDAHEERQVYAVARDGGEPRLLTRSPTDVTGFAWAPAGRRLAYTAEAPEAPEAAASAEAGDDVVVWSERERPVRLWIQPLDGEPFALTSPERSVRAFAWAPGGRRLALQVTEETGADADLMFRKLMRASVSPDAELRPLAETQGKLGDMAWSPDGLRVAYLGATSLSDPLAQSVFVVSDQGGEPRNLSGGFQGSAVAVFWLADDQVGFLANEGTRTTLNRVRITGGPVERLAGGGEEILSEVGFAEDRDRFAAVASTPTHPDEVFVGGLEDDGLTRLTRHNAWLEDVALGEQETVEWTGPDGLRVEGVLIRPAGARSGTRHPLAILPHGGPEGVSQDGWATRALYPAQVLAGRGYAVLMPNYRGSGGRGVAYSRADHRDLGGEEFLDVLAGIDHLADQGLVDPERVGISGTSYGGYFSAWAATRHSDRFKVAIPYAGISNWTSFTGTTDIPVEMSVVHFDLWWFDNPGIYWDRSPVAHVEEAATPTLIGHGLADDRVHPEQSLELYTALDLKGVPVELVYYPREPHGLRERAHQLDFMERILEWMDRYLQPDGRPVSQD